MTRAETKRIRQLNMGCWWPSKAFPRKSPDWPGICSELTGIVKEEEFYFAERGGNLSRLHELRALRQLAKDYARHTGPLEEETWT